MLAERRPTEEQFRAQAIRGSCRCDRELYSRTCWLASPDQKLKYFTQAVRLDPKYSHANFELGRFNSSAKAIVPPRSLLQKVASEQHPLSRSDVPPGIYRDYYLGEFSAAEQAFQIVAQQVPLNEVLNNLGAAQSRLNQPAAIENFKKALEGDSADPDYHFNVGYALLQQRRSAMPPRNVSGRSRATIPMIRRPRRC